jgi:TonB family protein
MLFAPQTPARRNFRGLAVSLLWHGAIVVWIMMPAIPERAPSEYRQKIAGKESKIVFYKFRRELPKVTPPKAKNEKLPLRAEVKAKQSIVASPKAAPKADRMIWTPAPEIAPAPLDLPNILAVKLPDPAPKPFVAPPEIVKPLTAKLDIPDAPDLAPITPATAQLKTTALPHKAFVQPTVRPQRVAVPVKLAPDTPVVEAAEVRAAQVPTSKLPPKPFTAPARSGGAAAAARVTPSPEPPSLIANSHELNIAIVGLNPNDKTVPLPAAPSPGQFSAGPVVRPKGATSEAGGNGLTVPNLTVHAPEDKTGKKTDLIAQAFKAPTSLDNLKAALSGGERIAPPPRVQAAPHSGATKVSGAPDASFDGRDVFMIAIQMPNITSFSGSWLMWYADREDRQPGLAPIAAPVAHHKVDPKYIASAISDRIEGNVILGCVIDKEGHIEGVELIRGLDSRLNQSAMAAMSKWEFFPATRNGEPVDVDVLVEIPFHLQPLDPK